MQTRRAVTHRAALAILVLLVTLTGALGSAPIGARVAAQGGPTATPTPLPRIADNGAEAMFPVGALLTVRLNIAQRQIRSARVRVTQPDAEGKPYNVWETYIDLQADVSYLSESASLIKYVWRVTPASAPPPFSTLSYEWEVRAVGQEGIATTKGTFVFQDTRLPDPEPVEEWQHTDPASPVALHSHNPELAINLLAVVAQRVYERVSADTGLRRTYKIVIYDPGAQFCMRDLSSGELYLNSRNIGGTRRSCDPLWVAQIYRRYDYHLLLRADLSFNAVQDGIANLIVSDQYAALWRKSGATVPAWFADGLFQLYNATARSGTLAMAREALQAGLLLSLNEMEAGLPPADAAKLRLWHAQSYLMTLYLASRYGASAPFDVARMLSADVPLEAAVQQRHAISVQAWEAGWRAWLPSEAAQSALRWTPYLVVTPLPTLSPTPIPSATPTSSIPTTTPTPSPTRTRFPTNTPIPATPTNTPLAPGKLQRPTLAPTQTPAPQGSGGPCGGAALVLLLPAGTVIARRAARLYGAVQQGRRSG